MTKLASEAYYSGQWSNASTCSYSGSQLSRVNVVPQLCGVPGLAWNPCSTASASPAGGRRGTPRSIAFTATILLFVINCLGEAAFSPIAHPFPDAQEHLAACPVVVGGLLLFGTPVAHPFPDDQEHLATCPLVVGSLLLVGTPVAHPYPDAPERHGTVNGSRLSVGVNLSTLAKDPYCWKQYIQVGSNRLISLC